MCRFELEASAGRCWEEVEFGAVWQRLWILTRTNNTDQTEYRYGVRFAIEHKLASIVRYKLNTTLATLPTLKHLHVYAALLSDTPGYR